MGAEGRPWTPMKIGFVVLPILLIVGLGAAWWGIRSHIDRRWEAMQERTRELIEEAKGRDLRRPVLRGEPIPGDAWDDYWSVVHELRGFSKAESDSIGKSGDPIGEAIRRIPEMVPVAFDRLLATQCDLLEAIRDGTRQAEVRYRDGWQEGWTRVYMIDYMNLCRSVPWMAVYRARFLREANDSRGAAGWLLDACQFAGDVSRNGCVHIEMMAMAAYGVVLDGLRDLVASGDMEQEGWLQVSRELEILDISFPPHGTASVNEAMFFGATDSSNMSIDPGDGVGAFTLFMTRLRYGFSTRLMLAEGMELLDRWGRSAAENEGRSWEDAKADEARSMLERENCGNPYILWAMPAMGGAAEASRLRRAQLRLLRMAACGRAGVQVPDLDDPFGTKILRAESEGRLRVWSVGPDGKDDGGKGDWKDQPGSDIVLDVRR